MNKKSVASSRVTNQELSIINRAVNGIVYINFGCVCMDIDTYSDIDEDVITLKVWDKPCGASDKKLIIDEEFNYVGLHATISEIERSLIDKSVM